jgi:transcriptional antiterminator
MDKEEQIINLLKEKKDGLTIQELANTCKFTRQTIAVKIAELKGEGKINIREIGKAKLISWKEGEATA